jgi:hypothetical protein
LAFGLDEPEEKKRDMSKISAATRAIRKKMQLQGFDMPDTPPPQSKLKSIKSEQAKTVMEAEKPVAKADSQKNDSKLVQIGKLANIPKKGVSSKEVPKPAQDRKQIIMGRPMALDRLARPPSFSQLIQTMAPIKKDSRESTPKNTALHNSQNTTPTDSMTKVVSRPTTLPSTQPASSTPQVPSYGLEQTGRPPYGHSGQSYAKPPSQQQGNLMNRSITTGPSPKNLPPFLAGGKASGTIGFYNPAITQVRLPMKPAIIPALHAAAMANREKGSIVRDLSKQMDMEYNSIHVMKR